MKKVAIGLVVGLTLVSLTSVSALAAGGGMPAAHEEEGQDFGGMVSGMAQGEPGAVADHIAEYCIDGQAMPDVGMPAIHGLTGEDFGIAVSEMAQSEPGAVADHIGSCVADTESVAEGAVEGIPADIPEVAMEGGVPAVHTIEEGNTFGDLVSGTATTDPFSLASHVSGREIGQ